MTLGIQAVVGVDINVAIMPPIVLDVVHDIVVSFAPDETVTNAPTIRSQLAAFFQSVAKLLLHDSALTWMPPLKQAIQSSSATVVVSVVPLERDVTGVPPPSCLADLSKIGATNPEYSQALTLVSVEPVHVTVTSFDSAAPATLYHRLQVGFVPGLADWMNVHPFAMDAFAMTVEPSA